MLGAVERAGSRELSRLGAESGQWATGRIAKQAHCAKWYIRQSALTAGKGGPGKRGASAVETLALKVGVVLILLSFIAIGQTTPPTTLTCRTLPLPTFCAVDDASSFLRTPMILIHGIHGDHKDDFDGWQPFIERVTNGRLGEVYKLYVFSYDSDGKPVKEIAGDLMRAVDRSVASGLTPGGQVVIVAHSMGGLVARSYLEEWNGAVRVSRLITLATPHHGSPLANDEPRANGYVDALWESASLRRASTTASRSLR